ncbi:hypothetical protein GBA52_027981 [Prunus armeniaca]|nr:hypothetical protein GBA52_027981 [Prunus armeniaca]
MSRADEGKPLIQSGVICIRVATDFEAMSVPVALHLNQWMKNVSFLLCAVSCHPVFCLLSCECSSNNACVECDNQSVAITLHVAASRPARPAYALLKRMDA